MTQPPGWYPDPAQPGGQRWWDGSQWTEHTQPAVQQPPQYGSPEQLQYGAGSPYGGSPYNAGSAGQAQYGQQQYGQPQYEQQQHGQAQYGQQPAYGQPQYGQQQYGQQQYGRPGQGRRNRTGLIIGVVALVVVLAGGVITALVLTNKHGKSGGGGGGTAGPDLSASPAPRQSWDSTLPTVQKDTGQRRTYSFAGAGSAGDNTSGITYPLADGWNIELGTTIKKSITVGSWARTEEDYACPNGEVHCFRGFITVGTYQTSPSSDLKKTATELMNKTVTPSAFGSINITGKAVPFLEKKTKVGTENAYLIRYKFQSGDVHTDTPGTWQVVVFDHAGRTDYLYIALDDVDGSPSLQFFDDFMSRVTLR